MKIKYLLISLILIVTNINIPALADNNIASINSELYIEAEDMSVNNSDDSLRISNDENAGGNKAVYFNKKIMDSSLVSEAALSYDYNVSYDGTYYLWARVWAENDASDSMWLKTEADSLWENKAVVIGDSYIWVRIKTYTLNAGNHTIYIAPREGNLKIDKFAILSDVLKIPEGKGNLSSYAVLYPEPGYKPASNVHPRVLFAENDIDNILENAQSEENNKALTKHREYISKNTTGILPACSPSTTNVNHNILVYIRHYAFEYALTGNEIYGQKAINAINNYLDTIYFPNLNYYSYAGNAVYTAACVYDWCYPLLKTNEEKDILVRKAISVASEYMEIGWPPQHQSSWGGHGSEKQLLRDLLALGIAVYDEYPHIYNNVAGRIFDEYIDFRDYFYDSHKTPYGTWYGVQRFEADCWANQLMSTIGYDNLWENQNMQYIPYWYMYMSRPDGYFMDEGDSRTNWESSPETAVIDTNNINIMMSSYFKDGYIKDEFLRFSDINTTGTDYILWLTLNDPKLAAKSVNELPLSKYFGYPSGSYIARTGWEYGKNSSSVVAHFKINEVNFADHNHWDAGGFQLYYKGNLATDSGYYQSVRTNGENLSNDANSEYNLNYYKQTIAHNAMVIYDPDEPITNFHHQTHNAENSGGQKSPGTGYPETLEEFKTGSLYQTAKVLGNEVQKGTSVPEYTYLKGDLTNSYSDKVKGYERSFMFLNLKNENTPAALVVFDRVETSSPDYKKKWLLHSSSAPVIDGSRTVIIDKKEGYDGRLVCDTLLPLSDNLEIRQAGETENDYYNFDGSVNWKTGGAYGSINEGGGIRTEISAVDNHREDYFLNVLQVGNDSEENIPLETKLITSQTHTGAEIYDRVVMFGKEKERVSSNVTFTIAEDGNYKFTVADLRNGVWTVNKNGYKQTSVIVTEEGGIAAFEGEAGEYELVYEGNRPYISSPSLVYPQDISNEELSEILNEAEFEKVKDKDAILVCTTVNNITTEYIITDYGMLASYENSNPVLEDNSVMVASAYKSSVNEKAEYKFGVIFSANGFSQSKLFFRPYIKVADGENEFIIYGDTVLKHIPLKNSIFKNYTVTNFRID